MSGGTAGRSSCARKRSGQLQVHVSHRDDDDDGNETRGSGPGTHRNVAAPPSNHAPRVFAMLTWGKLAGSGSLTAMRIVLMFVEDMT